MQPAKQTLLIASVFGFVAVAVGAFGAHALKPLLVAANRVETYELASRYLFYHTFALLSIGIWQFHNQTPTLAVAVKFFCAGILLFSGSLFVLALTGKTWLGMITPLGGVALLAGWATLGLAAFRKE
ncbi:MAG: DUF423 domain-containing protein [Cyclobacteriaceae bacterium]|nr:DUF423 domain-containing protein [Cyclobacteriaceae bacterium]